MNNLFHTNPMKHAKSRAEYLLILKDCETFNNMTKEQYDYEYEDHIIFNNGKICMYKCWGNTYYVGKDINEELYEFYLEDIDRVRVEIADNGNIVCHWDDENFPSILDIIEAEGFPIHFKLFRDYGVE
ncbi:MAG: hypothetical protein HUJ96_09415 [Marinilabiliaceae bacterium]|nr:hypothetical protein [Marinilabiliaceae bacterium]